jgi:hypothetical protein
MRTQFKRLFAISVRHAYYGGPCPDIAFTIPDDTRRALRGGRLLAKIVDQQLIVLYEADASGAAPIVNAAGTRLRFGALLTNASFANFTVLPIAPRGSTLLYDNTASAATLSGPNPVTLSSSIFAHAVAGTTRPVTVTATRDDAALRTDTVGEGRSAATFDLRGVDPGRFDVREMFTGGTTHITPYYLDPESQRDGVFAILEIDISAGFYTTAPALLIAFDAKEQALRYYIVVSNYSAADIATLTVGDAGFVEESRPQITFAPGAIDATTAATLGMPGSSLLLFESQAPVRRRALGRRKIQLKKNNAAIIENLPQPSATNPTADLIVHLSKPKRA